jgi:hypothetical protein
MSADRTHPAYKIAVPLWLVATGINIAFGFAHATEGQGDSAFGHFAAAGLCAYIAFLIHLLSQREAGGPR